MPTNVFISFQRNNLQQVRDIRALAYNPNHNLEFHDRSEIEPVKDKKGTPLPYQPDDERSKPIKNELRRLLKKTTKMVVVIGEYTHKSAWVNWEIQSFYDRIEETYGNADKRILAIYTTKKKDYTLPHILTTYSVLSIPWDMNELAVWIETNPNQEYPTLVYL